LRASRIRSLKHHPLASDQIHYSQQWWHLQNHRRNSFARFEIPLLGKHHHQANLSAPQQTANDD
jgi:hypothetical protein